MPDTLTQYTIETVQQEAEAMDAAELRGYYVSNMMMLQSCGNSYDEVLQERDEVRARVAELEAELESRAAWQEGDASDRLALLEALGVPDGGRSMEEAKRRMSEARVCVGELEQRLKACESAYALVCEAIVPGSAPGGAAAMAMMVESYKRELAEARASVTAQSRPLPKGGR